MGNFHISKRKTLAWYTAWAIRGCAILLALLVCAVFAVGYFLFILFCDKIWFQ